MCENFARSERQLQENPSEVSCNRNLLLLQTDDLRSLGKQTEAIGQKKVSLLLVRWTVTRLYGIPLLANQCNFGKGDHRKSTEFLLEMIPLEDAVDGTDWKRRWTYNCAVSQDKRKSPSTGPTYYDVCFVCNNCMPLQNLPMPICSPFWFFVFASSTPAYRRGLRSLKSSLGCLIPFEKTERLFNATIVPCQSSLENSFHTSALSLTHAMRRCPTENADRTSRSCSPSDLQPGV